MNTQSTAVDTKFAGCAHRYAHQVERLGQYLDAVQELVRAQGEKAFGFLLESAVVMMVAFLEEYLKCVVNIASYYREHDVRAHLLHVGNAEEQRAAASANVGALGRMMESRVSFKKQARRLESVFDFLFGFSPWPDPDSARLIRDLVRVRNVVVHAGGWPNESHYREMETPGFIVQTSVNPAFFRLNTVPAAPLIRDALRAAGMVAVHLERKFTADHKWHYSFPLVQFPRSEDSADNTVD